VKFCTIMSYAVINTLRSMSIIDDKLMGNLNISLCYIYSNKTNKNSCIIVGRIPIHYILLL